MITDKNVILVYVFFLVLGGLIGFIKAKSKMSLIMSLAFAIPLTLQALGYIKGMFYLDEILIGVLLIFFAKRFFATKAFMPGGLMSILSIVALALLLWKR